jgi:hypothetical protein
MSIIGKTGSVIALAVAMVATPVLADSSTDGSREISAQRRASVTVYPRRTLPGPNAIRHCDAWLEKEYRVSGTVVVPRMRCYWR